MHCIVTAGPTHEPIDKVRRLTNHSTGRLGTGLAKHLTGGEVAHGGRVKHRVDLGQSLQFFSQVSCGGKHLKFNAFWLFDIGGRAAAK